MKTLLTSTFLVVVVLTNLNAQVVNKGLYFEDDQYATYYVNRDNNDLDSNYTIGAFIRLDDGIVNDVQTIISAFIQGERFYFGINDQDQMEVALNGELYTADGDYEMDDGDCHHVAFSIDQSNITFIVDGYEVDRQTLLASSDLYNIPYFWLGNYLPELGNDHYFSGTIDGVQIWTSALNEQDIQNNIPNVDFGIGDSNFFLATDLQYMINGDQFEDYFGISNAHGELGPPSYRPVLVEACLYEVPGDPHFGISGKTTAACGTDGFSCNLICNGDFEYDFNQNKLPNVTPPGVFHLPSALFQSNIVTGWEVTVSSPDFFYTNSPLSNSAIRGGVPANIVGQTIDPWDFPAAGNNAFSGLFAIYDTHDTEGLKTELSSPLKSGVTYRLSFYAYTLVALGPANTAAQKQYVALRLVNGNQTYEIGGSYDSLPNYTQISTNNGWAHIVREFTLPANLNNVFDSLEIQTLVSYNGISLKPTPYSGGYYGMYSLIDDFDLGTYDDDAGLPIVVYIDSLLNNNYNDCPFEANYIGTDSLGDVYVALKSCEQQPSIGTPGFTYNFNNSNWPAVQMDYNDILLLRIGQDCGRVIKWAKKIEGQPYTTGSPPVQYQTEFTLKGLEVAPNGNFYLTGSCGEGSINFGNGQSITIPAPTGAGPNYNLWVAAFDANGNCNDAVHYGATHGAQIATALVYNEPQKRLVVSGYNLGGNAFNIVGTLQTTDGDHFVISHDISSNTLTNNVKAKIFDTEAVEHLAADDNRLYVQTSTNYHQSKTLKAFTLSSFASTSNPVATNSLHVASLPTQDGYFEITDMEARDDNVFLCGNTQKGVKLNGTGSTTPETALSTTLGNNSIPLATAFVAHYNTHLNYEAHYVLNAAASGGYAIHQDLYYGSAHNKARDLAINNSEEVVLHFTGVDVYFNSQRYYIDNENIAIIKLDDALEPAWVNFTTGDGPYNAGDLCLNENDEAEYFITYFIAQSLQEFDTDTLSFDNLPFALYIQNIEDLGSSSLFKQKDRETDASATAKQLAIYPNPAHTRVTVKAAQGEALNTIALFNISGAKVLAKELTHETTQTIIDLGTLPKGLYLLKVAHSGGEESIKLVVD